MIAGMHMPNRPIVADDLCAFRVSGCMAAKLMPYHTAYDATALMELGCKRFLVRLPDELAHDGRIKGDAEWARECVAVINKFAPLGITDYQLGNEPNLTWEPSKAGVWRWLTGRVATLIRKSSHVPPEVRLGLAPLAWNPLTWQSVQDVWVPQQKLILDMFGFCVVHSYWQKAEHFNLPPFGGNVTHFNHMFGGALPIVIGEWGNSSHERGLTAEEVERIRLEQYPAWIDWVSTLPYVEASYLFILSGTSDWTGFIPTDRILRAIGMVADRQEAILV